MTESKLKSDVVKYIKKNYPQYWIYCPMDRKISAIPDIILCADGGHFTAIELKVKGNDPGSKFKLQLYVLEQIRKAGGRATVCYSVNEVKNFLTKPE